MARKTIIIQTGGGVEQKLTIVRPPQVPREHVDASKWIVPTILKPSRGGHTRNRQHGQTRDR